MDDELGPRWDGPVAIDETSTAVYWRGTWGELRRAAADESGLVFTGSGSVVDQDVPESRKFQQRLEGGGANFRVGAPPVGTPVLLSNAYDTVYWVRSADALAPEHGLIYAAAVDWMGEISWWMMDDDPAEQAEVATIFHTLRAACGYV